MSDEEKLNDVGENAEENISQEGSQKVKLPEDDPALYEALHELFEAEPPKPPVKEEAEEREPEEAGPQEEQAETEGQEEGGPSLLDKLPPQEFFEYVKDELTPRQRKILMTAYQHPNVSQRQIARMVGTSNSYVTMTFKKLMGMWAERSEEFERFKAGEVPEMERVSEVEESGRERSPSKTKKPPTRKGSSGGEDERITNAVYQMSKATTIFKEVDKTVAQLLGAEFHDAAIKKDVYARLGELLIYTLLQLGAIDRDQIVAYSQQLVEDPNVLYFYVKEQLDAVIKITDPDKLKKIWMENANLRMKLLAYEATADMLSDALNYYAQVIRFLVSLLDRKQLEKFAMWIYMFEFMRRKKKKANVGGDKFAGAGLGSL